MIDENPIRFPVLVNQVKLNTTGQQVLVSAQQIRIIRMRDNGLLQVLFIELYLFRVIWFDLSFNKEQYEQKQ